jgi:hypothetical protein
MRAAARGGSAAGGGQQGPYRSSLGCCGGCCQLTSRRLRTGCGLSLQYASTLIQNFNGLLVPPSPSSRIHSLRFLVSPSVGSGQHSAVATARSHRAQHRHLRYASQSVFYFFSLSLSSNSASSTGASFAELCGVHSVHSDSKGCSRTVAAETGICCARGKSRAPTELFL